MPCGGGKAEGRRHEPEEMGPLVLGSLTGRCPRTGLGAGRKERGEAVSRLPVVTSDGARGAFASLTSVSAGPGLGEIVKQEPSRAICRSGASVVIRCHAVDLQAYIVYWYRQFPKQGLTLMATSNQGSSVKYEQGFSEAEFPIHHPDTTFFNLTAASAQPADSCLYLCGASDTALG